MNTVTLQLPKSGWWVRCRPMPNMAYRGAMKQAALRHPPPPMVEIPVGKKGEHTETVEAAYDSPEWLKYEAERSTVESKREAFQEQWTYAYGVVAWSKDKKKWTKDPLAKWKLDQFLADSLSLDMTDKMVRRASFIMYELLCMTEDLKVVDVIIYQDEQEPITVAEIDAAEDSFRDPVQGNAVTEPEAETPEGSD